MPQRDYREVAKAFFKEAMADLRAARLLRDGGEYSRAVAACQQAVEKAAKAALVLKGIVVLEHDVADRLVVAFPHMEGVRQLARKIRALELEGTRTRYPLFGRVDLPIWTPSERYDMEAADAAIADTLEVIHKLTAFIEQEYRLKLKEDQQ